MDTPLTKLPLLVALSLGACGPGGGMDGDGTGGGDSTADAGANSGADGATSRYCDKMDIVFVIDNSDTMREEQDNLIANFPGFVQVLDEYDTLIGNRELDYRMAVTTTSRAFDWTLDLTPAVPIPSAMSEQGLSGAFRQECDMSRAWIERGDANVSETFSCLANVGTGGSRFEMPLYNLQLALGPELLAGANQGFLRDDALLGIVILSDEDDCSRADENFTETSNEAVCAENRLIAPASTIALLDQVKGQRSRWATAVIAGPGPGPCSSALSNAEEASRLQGFVSATGDNGVFSSICQDDLAAALKVTLETFKSACEEFDPID